MASVCFLSHSAIADDPRVRRHAETLQARGAEVSAVGYAGGRSEPPEWPIYALDEPSWGLPAKVARALRMLPARLHPWFASPAFWSSPENRRMLRLARATGADVFVANDWNTLPVASAASADGSGLYVYDSHELAVGEHADRLSWRLTFPPYVRALEQKHIGGAAAVITVGDGIAEHMQHAYGLRERPNTIRNLPPYQEQPYRPLRGPASVLFHGAVIPGRGLEALVASVPDWQGARTLTIRGPGAPSYLEGLERLIHEVGVGERVRIEPPARPNDLVALANQSDIGIHPLPGTILQNRLAQPNKLFEYLMAGLAVCVTDLDEMRAVVRQFGVGGLIAVDREGEVTPEAVAAAVNSMTDDEIDRCKSAALLAARRLNWAIESERLADAFAPVIDLVSEF